MDIRSQLFRLNRYLNILAQNSSMSSARLEVLRLVKLHNPMTLRQLCDIQQVSMPTMSKLVDELQNQALVIRAQSKDDARQRWIVPTQKGIQQLADAEKQSEDFWQTKFSHLDEAQLRDIENALRKVNDAIASKAER